MNAVCASLVILLSVSMLAHGQKKENNTSSTNSTAATTTSSTKQADTSVTVTTLTPTVAANSTSLSTSSTPGGPAVFSTKSLLFSTTLLLKSFQWAFFHWTSSCLIFFASQRQLFTIFFCEVPHFIFHSALSILNGWQKESVIFHYIQKSVFWRSASILIKCILRSMPFAFKMWRTLWRYIWIMQLNDQK